MGSNGDDVDGNGIVDDHDVDDGGIVVDDDVVFLLAEMLVPANLLGEQW